MPNRKKIIISIALVLLIIAAVPFVGNQVVEDLLKQRVELLHSYGVEAVESTTDASYLEIKKHYKFLVKDEEKFVTYLNQFSDAQLPPYVNAALKGVVIGVDAVFSNLPLSEAVSLDIYPLSLSTEMMSELEKEDAKFYTYLKKFLESKGVLYHINYNVLKDSFDGYIKDIQEMYLFDNKTEMKLTLLDATYRGSGPILAPNSLVSHIKKIDLQVSQNSEVLLFELKDFSTDATFETKSTYTSSAKVQNVSFKVQNFGKDMLIDAKNLKMHLSSNTEGKYAEVAVKNSIENFTIFSKEFDVNTTDFNYDIAFSDIDKDSLKELTELLSSKNRQQLPRLAEELESVGIKLLSKGLKFEVKDFSLKNITLDKSRDLEGFLLNSTLLLKPDADFAQKVKNSPMHLVSSVDVKSSLKLSKKIFKLITEINPMAFMAQTYAKEEGDSLVFNITFINGEFRVNGKALQ